jgi:Amt family ammonium transporter
VAGLVAVTPASGFVTPLGGLIIGLIAGVVCYLFVCLKAVFGYDDSLDAFGVHGLGGAWGALASGIFATSLGSGIESNGQQILVQLKGIGFTAIFAPVMSLGILLVLKLVFGSLRVGDEAEFEGLDVSEHSESAYSLGSGATMGAGAHGAGTPAPAFSTATATKTA